MKYVLHFIILYFDNARKDCFKISDDKLTITNIEKISDFDHTIYMKHWIDSTSNQIIKWRFKINEHQTWHHYFGLASTFSEEALEEDFVNGEKQRIQFPMEGIEE